VDAPRHFLKNGVTVDSFPLDVMIGSAFVVHIPDVPLVTPRELNRADIPESTERILIRTRNSDRWASGALDFFDDFTAISTEAAVWLVQRDIKLVGIDCLSIQPFHSHPNVHKTLMEHGIAILEGLDLRHVPNGTYELLCLPLKLIGVEAAPVRAVLRRPLVAPHSRIVGSGGAA
jgi:arylformamidase